MTLTDLLTLDRPIVSLDLETTGTNVSLDRIVQIGVVKLYPDGKLTEWEQLVNPTVLIPAEATAVHGIDRERVKDMPTFRQLSSKLFAGLEGCDLCGYNLAGFDVPLLAAEFARCGVTWPSVARPLRIIDAFKIWLRFSPRNLSAGVEAYLHRKHENAHSALADAKASLEIFSAQMELHTELPRSVEALNELFFVAPRDAGTLDPDGKIAWRGTEAVLTFGKHSGRTLREIDADYVRWLLQGRNSAAVTRILTEALEGKYPVRI